MITPIHIYPKSDFNFLPIVWWAYYYIGHNAKVTMEGVTILTIVNYMLMPLTSILFIDTRVKKMKWALSLMMCHFLPRVTESHERLEMAPSERGKDH